MTTPNPTDTQLQGATLEPCPFCGSPAHVRETKAHGALPIYWVECVICEIGTKYHDSPNGAAETWNARHVAVAGPRGDEEWRTLIVKKLRELEVKFNWTEIGEVITGVRQYVESLPATSSPTPAERCKHCGHESTFSDEGTTTCKKPVRTEAAKNKSTAETHADDFTACACYCEFAPAERTIQYEEAYKRVCAILVTNHFPIGFTDRQTSERNQRLAAAIAEEFSAPRRWEDARVEDLETTAAPAERTPSSRGAERCVKCGHSTHRWHGFCQARASEDVVNDRVCGCECEFNTPSDSARRAAEAATRLREFCNGNYSLIAQHFNDTTKDRDITGDVEELTNPAATPTDNDAVSDCDPDLLETKPGE